MDDVRILRTAAIELCDADSSDVVKVAGILRRITNWWKAFMDPEYRKQIDALRDQSLKVNDLLAQLGSEIEALQSAIVDADVSSYENALRNVREMSTNLAAILKTYNVETQKVEQNAPKDTVDVPTPEDTPEQEGPARLPYYTKTQLEDPTVREQLKTQLPSDYDIPVGIDVSKPILNFNWFASVSPNDFYLSEHFISFFQRHLAEAMARKISITADPDYNQKVFLYLAQMPEVEKQLREQIPIAAISGTLVRVDFQTPSTKVTHRTANEMRTEIQTAPFTIIFPPSDYFDGPKRVELTVNILFNDMRAAYIRGQRLGAFGDKYLRIIGHDFPIPVERAVQASNRMASLMRFAPNKGELKKIAAILDSDWVASKAVTHQQQRRAVELLKTWRKGLISLEDGVQYRGDYHPNYPGQLPDLAAPRGMHRGVEVWVPKDSPAAKSPAKNIPPWKPDPSKRAPMNERELVLAEFEKRGWPRDEANAMVSVESGWDPSARNVQGFSGLIGFAPWLGPGPSSRFKNKWGLSKPIWEMSAAEQAPLIGRYLDEFVHRRWRFPGDTYMTGAAPSFVGAPDSQVVYPKGTKAWEQNPGWRPADGGDITAGSIRAAVLRKMRSTRDSGVAVKTKAPTPIKLTPEKQTQEQDAMQEYNVLMRQLAASAECGPIERIARRVLEEAFLPNTRVLLVIGHEASMPARMRYARILASALREELGAETSIHHQNDRLEMECDVRGPEQSVLLAVKGLSDGVANAFAMATKQDPITVNGYIGIESKYPLLDSNTSETNFRKFAFEIMVEND